MNLHFRSEVQYCKNNCVNTMSWQALIECVKSNYCVNYFRFYVRFSVTFFAVCYILKREKQFSSVYLYDQGLNFCSMYLLNKDSIVVHFKVVFQFSWEEEGHVHRKSPPPIIIYLQQTEQVYTHYNSVVDLVQCVTRYISDLSWSYTDY